MHQISLENIEYVHLLLGEKRNLSSLWQCRFIILIIELLRFSDLQTVVTEFYDSQGSRGTVKALIFYYIC